MIWKGNLEVALKALLCLFKVHTVNVSIETYSFTIQHALFAFRTFIYRYVALLQLHNAIIISFDKKLNQKYVHVKFMINPIHIKRKQQSIYSHYLCNANPD